MPAPRKSVEAPEVEPAAASAEIDTAEVEVTEDERIAQMEAEGMTTGDAQAAVEAEQELAARAEAERATSVSAQPAPRAELTTQERIGALVKLREQAHGVKRTGQGHLATKCLATGVYATLDGKHVISQAEVGAEWRVEELTDARRLRKVGTAETYYKALAVVDDDAPES